MENYRVHTIISKDGVSISFLDKNEKVVSDRTILKNKFKLNKSPNIDLDYVEVLPQNMYALKGSSGDIALNNGVYVKITIHSEEVEAGLVPGRVKARFEDVCRQIEVHIKSIDTLNVILPLEI